MPRLSENAISFFGAGGHKHDGVSSTLISTDKYSLFDFNPGYIGSQSRITIQQANQAALEEWVMNLVNTKVLAPAGLDLAPGLLSGKSIRANTITAVELQANTITASEIAAGTITANQLSSNIILVNNVIRSNNYNGTIAANGAITANGNAGWAITSFGSAEFANAVIRGNVTANAGSIGGWTISSNSITAGSTTLSSTGAVTFGNTVIASNGQITNGGYTLSNTGVLTATGAIITGTINASGGTIDGYLSSGGVDIGYLRPYIYSYYKGINLSANNATDFTNVFMRGNGGEVYFRVDNGTQWLKFENGTVQIETPFFEVNGASGRVGAFAISNTTLTASGLDPGIGGGYTSSIELATSGQIKTTIGANTIFGNYATSVYLNRADSSGGISVVGNAEDGGSNSTTLIGAYRIETRIFQHDAYTNAKGHGKFTASGTHVNFGDGDTAGYTMRIVRDNDLYGQVAGGSTLDVLVNTNNTLVAPSSSIRFKENVNNLDIDYKKILGIQPVTFYYKDRSEEEDGGERHLEYGVIAEQVEEAGVTQLVNYKDGVPFAVTYSKMSVFLLEVCRKQEEVIEGLSAKLILLETRLQALEGV